jgi:hypothetical protein
MISNPSIIKYFNYNEFSYYVYNYLYKRTTETKVTLS